MSDIISDFMTMTEHAFSPGIFRLWSGIALCAGALERRVWAEARSGRQTFPNSYAMLVAPPGVGKQVIEIVRRLWVETREIATAAPAFKLAPDSVTKASLMDCLGKARNSKMLPAAPGLEYHSLLVAAEEMSMLMPGYDLEFIGALNKIWNNPDLYEETRRASIVKELRVPFPQINILCGAQPGWLGSVFPEEAWTTGFTSRTIMVYSSDRPIRDLFDDGHAGADIRPEVLAGLSRLSNLYGPIGPQYGNFAADAAKFLNDWHRAGGPPTPTHSKLEHYVNRRSEHAIKLAVVSGASRTGEARIDRIDAERAIGWLIEAERTMPDIFRAMVGRSDKQILEELHGYVTRAWDLGKRKPVPGRLVYSFLAQRVPSDKIDKLLDLADKAHMVQRVAGEDSFVPKPRYSHGVE